MVLVGDRGMAKSQNIAQLMSGGDGYIVGRNADAAVKCSTTSKARPANGSNARLASPQAKNRSREGHWSKQ